MRGRIEQLALVATNYRRIGLGRLGALVIQPDDLEALQGLQQAMGASELVYLATCNRVECYLVLPEQADPTDEQLLGRARAFFSARGAAEEADSLLLRRGEDVVAHLFEVAASLDSLLLGETQISGQAKRAEERARQQGLSGRGLQTVFERAIAASRRVRSETRLGQVPVSAASVAVSKVKQYFGEAGPRVSVLIGTGEMTVKAAQALTGKPGQLIFVNRTRAGAEALAERFGGQALSLDELKAAPPAWIDLLFTATAATETVIGPEVLEPALAARPAGAPPMIICDLGLPRDVDTCVDQDRRCRVIDMQTVEAMARQNQLELTGEADRARAILADELCRCLREDRFRQLAGQGAEAFLAAELAHLGEEDRAAVLAFAVGLAGRLARQPQFA